MRESTADRSIRRCNIDAGKEVAAATSLRARSLNFKLNPHQGARRRKKERDCDESTVDETVSTVESIQRASECCAGSSHRTKSAGDDGIAFRFFRGSEASIDKLISVSLPHVSSCWFSPQPPGGEVFFVHNPRRRNRLKSHPSTLDQIG